MSELHIIPPKLRLDIALLYLFVRIRTFLSRHFSLTPSPFIRDNLILNDKDLKQTPLLFLIPQNLWKYKMGGYQSGKTFSEEHILFPLLLILYMGG